MDVKAVVAVLLGTLVLGGCGAARYTESDEGTTQVVTRGDTFSVSLAAASDAAPAVPLVEGALIRFVGRRTNLESGRDVYEFSAEGVGEAEIRIRPPGTPPGAAAEYVLRVRVESDGKAPSSRSAAPSPGSY